MWVPCNNGLYDTEDIAKCTSFQIEGLEFNRRFAPGIYLGMTPVLSDKKQRIRCGPLIRWPKRRKLKLKRQHALVMKRLDDDWRLDHQLCRGELATEIGMEFLAREVVRMHSKLALSPRDRDMGKPDSISSKLALNRRLFDEALNKLVSQGGHDHELHIEKYRSIGELMERTCKDYTMYFEQRCQNGCIKRCHGDLKTTNLWVHPASKNHKKELLALDCVDFNPEFCHIDTLSDIAMLTVDIEMRLTNCLNKDEDQQLGRKLVRHFLSTYLQETGQDSEVVWPLLEYYMTEKAMVCAYIGILYKYEDLPMLSEKYIDVALTHTQRLEKLLATAKK